MVQVKTDGQSTIQDTITKNAGDTISLLEQVMYIVT